MGTGSKPILGKIPLGITEDEIPLGSHLLHFWRTDEEFESGVRFLRMGIADQSQYCVLFGLNIFMHGLSRIVNGWAAFADTLVPMFQKTPLPAWSVHVFGLILPWAEAVLGFLLLIGFCTSIALAGGSLLILVLTFGTTLRQDWQTAGIQLIYAAVYAALLATDDMNQYSLDGMLLRLRKQRAM